nr:MAG TPA: hypothetical protein [Caudoviricetes sp.]
MTFHGCVAAAGAGAVVHPVFDSVDAPSGALALAGDVVDLWGGQHALEEVTLDCAVREANVLGEGADAEVLGCHWISFLLFPSDMNKST